VKRAAILVVGLLVAGVCSRLGIWQLQRLDERNERNRRAEQQLARPALPLHPMVAPDIAADPDMFRFRAVVATGRFDLTRELVVIARAHHGVPGVHVVTPLMLDDSLAVLVERGWLPSPDGRTVHPPLAPEPPQATVEGVLLLVDGRSGAVAAGESWPRRVMSPAPELVGSGYPYRLLPLLLRRRAPPAGSSLRSVDLPALSSGPHLSYAVQWFGFAAIALVGSIVFFVRRGDDTPSQGLPPSPS
jgi:surfeit locus 1 family protein